MHRSELLTVFLFFIFVTLAFFHKIFFGLLPIPADLITGGYYPWLDYKWGNVVGVAVKNPILSDAVSIMYPLKSYAATLIQNGQLPLWNPYMFGGYPLLASLQLGLFFPTMIFYLFLSTPIAWTLQVMFQPLLASFFSYLFLRNLKLSPTSSLMGALIYGFGGFSMLWLEWNTHVATASFLPLLLFLSQKLIQTRRFFWGGFLSLAVCFQIFAGYIQIIPFCLLITLLWNILHDKKHLFLKNGLHIGLWIGLGVGLSAIFLLPSLELLQNSQRIAEKGALWEAFFSLSFLITMLVPDFFGNPATANFWGEGNYLSVAIYSSVVAVTLALGSLFHRTKSDRQPVLFFGILFFITLFLISHNPVSAFLYNAGLFGGTSVSLTRLLFIPNFCVAVLAAIGLESFLLQKRFPLRVPLYLTLGLVSTMATVFIIIFFLKSQSAVYPNEAFLKEITPALLHYSTALRNSILPIILLGATFMLLVAGQFLKTYHRFIVLLLFPILLFDLFRFGLKYNSFSPQNYLYPSTPITDFLQKNLGDFRFTAEKEILSANMWVPYKLNSYPGYDGVYPYHSAKLIAVINSNDPKAIPQTKWGVLDNQTSPLLSLTSTKYILALKRNPQGEIKPDGTIGYQYQKATHLKPIFEDKSVVVLENTKVIPRAYFTYTVIKGSDETQTLKNLILNPTQSHAYSPTLELNSHAPKNPPKITYTSLSNTQYQLTTDSDNEGFLVLTNTYYPGWKATIDGTETQIHQTNFAFQGIQIPAGKHTIQLTYQPKSLFYGSLISFGALIGMITLVFFKKRFNS